MSTPKAGSLTAEAHARLRADILSCRLIPGQKLIIQDLCDSFGFGLGAVREALSRGVVAGIIVRLVLSAVIAARMSFMPHKFNADRRHKIAKQQYRVTNRAAYNESLRRRGDLTI
ncbi:GntR family transcriptional regulator [Rhizobium rhizogenes]|uniref:GntR family transcriptional regulator n=1 Tax=Rhizobium rhizogenes TaxID=359 RepID=UPI001F37F468|nr:GntR family transcriptional regulator [Rhizobium rhizogenes]